MEIHPLVPKFIPFISILKNTDQNNLINTDAERQALLFPFLQLETADLKGVKQKRQLWKLFSTAFLKEILRGLPVSAITFTTITNIKYSGKLIFDKYMYVIETWPQ